MASEDLLAMAASRLEPLMVGDKSNTVLKSSIVAQVSAAIYYQSHVMVNVMKNKQLQNKFQNIIFKQIDQDFLLYMDAQARTKPKQYHHVYEWNRQGDASARLFKLNKLMSNDFSLRINYELTPSQTFVPTDKGKNRYVFANKASVMEAGMPVTIAPRAAERLVFDVKGGYTVYMPKGASVTVRQPGGPATKNSFRISYERFFTGQLVNLSIKKSGFQKIFNTKVKQAMGLPADIKRVKYSFSPNTVRSMASNAINMVGA